MLLSAAMPADAQWLKTKTPGIPRTKDGKPNLTAPAPKAPDGRPDLSGIWRTDALAFSLDVTTDLKPGEILPWAEALAKERTARFATDHPLYRCMPEIGPNYNMTTFKFVQSGGTLAMLPEGGPYRQILIDGRALPEDPQPTWMGYSVGHWEGNTMIVESAGFNDRTWLDYSGHPHTEALRTTERYTRKDFGHMDIQITYNDPKAYTRPWTITLHAALMADTELLENVCNENDKSSRQHFVITDDDKRKGQSEFVIPADVLSSYAGSVRPEDGGKVDSVLTGVRKRPSLRRATGWRQDAARRGVRNDVLGAGRASDLSQGRERRCHRLRHPHRRRRSGVYPGTPALIASRPWPCGLVSRTLSA